MNSLRMKLTTCKRNQVCRFQCAAALLIAATLVVLVILASGCGSLIPSERSKSQSVQATEALAVEQERTIRRVMEVGPQASITTVRSTAPGGKGEVVSVPVRESLTIETSTKTGAGSASQAQGNSEITIPFGVKIGLAAAGLLLLVFAVRYAIKSARGTALGEALSMADEVLANAIRSKRAEVAMEREPGAQARIQTEIANLEAERGRLANKKVS